MSERRWVTEDGVRRKRKVSTRGHRKALLKTANPVCGICKNPIERPGSATIDHIIPLSKGGTNYRENVQLAHPRCNRRKGDRLSYNPGIPGKERCPHCHRWRKNLRQHVDVMHKEVVA